MSIRSFVKPVAVGAAMLMLASSFAATAASAESISQPLQVAAKQELSGVMGTVTLPDDIISQDVNVYAVLTSADYAWDARIAGTYDAASGTFNIQGLADGEYHIVAWVGDGGAVDQKTVTVAGADVQGVQLSIPRVGMLNGYIKLPSRFFDDECAQTDWKKGDACFTVEVKNTDTGQVWDRTIWHGMQEWGTQYVDEDGYTPAGNYLVTLNTTDPATKAQKSRSWSISLRSGELRQFDLVLNVDTFTDISSSAFKTEIQWLADQGVTTGYSKGDGTAEYRPTAQTTRDAFVEFLYRAAGQPSVDTSVASPFNDVGWENEHYRAILWAYQSGLVKGWDDGGFHPYQSIQRDAVATILKRYAEYLDVDIEQDAAAAFSDISTSEHADNIRWLAATGITTGYADGTFKPLQPVTRDAIAAFLYRLNQKSHS
ncbi:S-layer homology domain-containing protein [Pseudoclavibacter soli]|uniref:S-layer homology domain-containing protein n=1 Tax=Pseudoclavibacter soli TaxID=452623 RepID=UPI0006860AF6|nr:S-layer homology domain-containing protein [Pseudoclavibacter soli]